MGIKDFIASDISSLAFNTDDFAETARYEPADSEIPAFMISAIFRPVIYDDLEERNVVSDRIECEIAHSDFVNGDISEPTRQYSGQTGDIIVKPGPGGGESSWTTVTGSDVKIITDGTEESWTVIDAEYDSGQQVWRLELRKNMRLVTNAYR